MGFYFAILIYFNVPILYVLILNNWTNKYEFWHAKLRWSIVKSCWNLRRNIQVRGSQVQCQAPDIGPDVS